MLQPHQNEQNTSVRVGRTVCYIVAAVIINKDKILMVQEAKSSCRGKWYLPAGRVERAETLVDAVRREMKEESGFEFEPQTVTCVEIQRHFWMRFSFFGRLVGGSLKVEPDKESLKAAWLDLSVVLTGGSREFPLRSNDVETCIQATQQFLESKPKPSWFLPSAVTHEHIVISLVLYRDKTEREIVVSCTDGLLPYVFFGPKTKGSFSTLKSLFDSIFEDTSKQSIERSDLSVIDVEFTGGRDVEDATSDGICLIVAADVNAFTTESIRKDHYEWVPGPADNSNCSWAVRLGKTGVSLFIL